MTVNFDMYISPFLSVRQPKSTNHARLLRMETLENRCLLSSDSQAFFGFGSISASFPSDNTQLGFRSNELQSQFDEKFGAGNWKPVIERAIQTWAQYAEINIGLVDDDGSPAGVYGPTRGDSRFGDIRIFGIALSSNVWAEAISEDARSAGTWAGDVIFNTAAEWRNLQDLESAAVHEIGHVLGLGHSDDPNSPMHTHGPSLSSLPTPEDVALLQLLHGARGNDPNESQNGNDEIDRASRIRGDANDGSVSGGFSGDQVWIQFGDLLNTNDVDIFEIQIANEYTGPLAVQIQSSGLSLARLHAELLDRNGNVLDASGMLGSFGGTAAVSLSVTEPQQKLYIRITSTEPMWTAGDYSITVANPTRLANEQHEIAEWTQEVHRWYFESRGNKNGFSYQLRDPLVIDFSDDDSHTDDTSASAVDLQPVFASDLRTVYTTVGAINNHSDIDYYRFRTPDEIGPNSNLLIDLQSLEVNGLIPAIEVLSEDMVEISMEVMTRGYGATQLLLSNVLPNQRYVIRLDAANVASTHQLGNFSLSIEISTELSPNEVFLSGVLSSEKSLVENTLYVARTQLLSFSLFADTLNQAGPIAAQVTFRLFDSERRLVTTTTAPVGDVRSLPGTLLDAGEYYIQISSSFGNTRPQDLNVRLSGKKPSQPIGPLVAPVDEEPLYACENGIGFCYPNGIQTPDSTLVDRGPIISLPPPTAHLIPPPDLWFWGGASGQNKQLPTDVNGDGIISPLDVLLIVNYLNANGSGRYPDQFVGYLDVSDDSFISPLDVILVINQLNLKANL